MASKLTRREFLVASMTSTGAVLAACATPTAAPETAQEASAAPETAPAEMEKTITFNQGWGTYNPIKPTLMGWGAESQLVPLLTHSRLMEFGNLQTKRLGIAERAEVSPDASQYTFYMRQDVKFHDGTPLTARDVEATAKLYLTKEANVNPIFWIDFIAGGREFYDGASDELPGVEVIDDYTIRFTLAEPFARWDDTTICEMNILPAHILENVNPEDLKEEYSPAWFQPETHMGSGPFKFVAAERDQFVELVRNDDYYLGQPKLDRIMIRNFGESDTQFIALEKGDLDVWNVPSPYLERVKALPNVDVFEVNRLYHRMLRVNEQKPYLSDMRVRQALLYAIDRKALCEELESGMCIPWDSFMQQPDWVPEGLNPYEYNPDKARELLAQAEADGVWDPNQELTLEYYYDNPTHHDWFAAIQQNLADVGVKSQPLLLEGTGWVKRNVECEFDLAYEGFGTSHITAYRGWFIKDDGCRAMWNTDEADELFLKVQTSPDEEVQREYMTELQHLVNEQLPVIPFVKYVGAIAVNKRIAGFDENAIWLMQSIFNTGWNNAHNWDVTS